MTDRAILSAGVSRFLGNVTSRIPQIATPVLAAARIDSQDATGVSATLQSVFANYGVDATIVGSVRGPSVTLYLVRPGAGVKVAKVAGLVDEIGLALGSDKIRVAKVVAGRQAMGIEVPNATRDDVRLPDLLAGAMDDRRPLLIGLGVDVQGAPVLVDIASWPHGLIAGETGGGKSEMLNSIICSVLARATPAEVRLLLIDPKRVELAAYAKVPHLLRPIVTDPAAAVQALNWAVQEMERRYALLEQAGARNIDAYNARVPVAERLAKLLIVVDELADLMIVAKAEVEESVVRIAQLARAAGEHLVLATQRPSVDVVTGLIKANMPVRIALRTASDVDSRVVLGENGAEKLLGRGDALYRSAEGVVRLQGALITEAEIAEVVANARRYARPAVTATPAVESRAAPAQPRPLDDEDLLAQARELVVTSQYASTTVLQRKLRVGFARAGRLMDQLEELGVVGPENGSAPREVLIKPTDA